MSYLTAVEALLDDAVAAGHFSGLPGEGRPLRYTPDERLAGDQALGFKVLQNGGMLPEWLNLGRQVEHDEQQLRAIDREHAELATNASSIDDWQVAWPALFQLRARYEKLARALRRSQEKFNWEAPGRLSQRPPIWVEYHLERLDSRLSSPLRSSLDAP